MASVAEILFGYRVSDEIIELFCNKDISQPDARRVADTFVETHARGIVSKLNSEVPKGLESIHYEANLPGELFTDGFIFNGYTHMVGNVIAKAYEGYKLYSVSGGGMTFKKE